MSLDTYSGLLTAISDWLMRSDLDSTIPQFVALAEADLARRLRLRSMVTRATLTATSGVAPLPSDYLQAKTVSTEDGQITYLPPTQYGAAEPVLLTGSAEYYTVEGSDLRILPPVSGDVTITYYARPEALSDANPTNVILAEHPDVLLWGSLLTASAYLFDDQRTGLWQTLLSEAIARAETADDAAEHAGHLTIRTD